MKKQFMNHFLLWLTDCDVINITAFNHYAFYKVSESVIFKLLAVKLYFCYK